MNNHSSKCPVKINGSELIIESENMHKITLSSKIQKTEEFDNAIVVMVHPNTSTFLNDNVFGVSYDAKILWQVMSLKHIAYKHSPFTGMVRMGKNIKLCNWDGTDLIVDPTTGEVIEKRYSK